MPSKKGQGLSLSTVIIAILVLVVLVILVMVTTGFFGKRFGPEFGRLTDTSCNGRVIDSSQECDSHEKENYAVNAGQGKKCCVAPKCGDPGTDTKCVGDVKDCKISSYHLEGCSSPTPLCCKG